MKIITTEFRIYRSSDIKSASLVLFCNEFRISILLLIPWIYYSCRAKQWKFQCDLRNQIDKVTKIFYWRILTYHILKLSFWKSINQWINPMYSCWYEYKDITDKGNNQQNIFFWRKWTRLNMNNSKKGLVQIDF